MKEKNTNKTEINYRIYEIKAISHFENDYSEYNIPEEDVKRGKGPIQFGLNIDSDKGIVSFLINARYSCNVDGKEQDLFGIKALFSFQIKNFADVIPQKKQGEFNIPEPLMLTFLNISISGTRGMLVTLNTNPVYKSIYLPIVNLESLLESLSNSLKT